MANPSLSRQFTLTNFTWKLRANGHLKGEKIGAVNYLKLSRIPSDIRIYWNSTNNRDTAFSVDELVRGFKINERDEAGNAKTLDNVWLWSEGEIPIEPLNDVIEIEYNGAGDLIEPLLGNKSGAIDKIEKVQVVSAIDKVLNPIKVVNQNNTLGYKIDDFYRINANIKKPTTKTAHLQIEYELTDYADRQTDIFGFFRFDEKGKIIFCNTNWLNGGCVADFWNTINDLKVYDSLTAEITGAKNLVGKNGKISNNFLIFMKTIQYPFTQDSLHHSRYCLNKQEFAYPYSVNSNQSTELAGYSYFEYSMYHTFLPNGFFEKLLKVVINDEPLKKVVKGGGAGTFKPAPFEIIGSMSWETTYDEQLGLYIFKTQNKTSFIAPVQTQTAYISLLAEQNNKKADFKITLAELSKTSAQDCSLYIGGLDGIKVPIKSGFELCFNNKKTGMDYAVIEIPAGDIYKIELELINVYEDTQDA